MSHPHAHRRPFSAAQSDGCLPRNSARCVYAEPICSPLPLPCSWHVHSTTVRTVVVITTHRSTRRHCAIFSLAPTGSEGCGKTTPASALINCLAHYLLATVWLPGRRTLPARGYVTMYLTGIPHLSPQVKPHSNARISTEYSVHTPDRWQ